MLIRSKINSGSVTELSWVITGQVLNVGLGFVIIKLLSKLGTEEFGIYSLVITISSLLVLIIYGPLVQGFIRFYYHYSELKLLNLYFKVIYKLFFITGALFLLITLIVSAGTIFIDIEITPLFVLFAGTYILSIRMAEFFNAFLTIIRKRKQNSLLQGAEKLFYVLTLLLLLTTHNFNLTIIFAGFSFISLIFTLIKFRLYRKYTPSETDVVSAPADKLRFEIRSQVLTYMLPFMIWGFTAWLQLNGEKWIIASLLSISDVGIYAVMFSLVTAFIMVPSAILAEFITPIIFQNYTDIKNPANVKAGYIYIKLTMLIVILVTLFTTVLTAAAGEEIIILITNNNFTTYWYLLPALCFGAGLYNAGQALTTLGMALNEPKKYLPPKIITGVFSISVNFLLIYFYGITGTAYAIILTGILYFIYIIYVNRKIISSMKAV